MADWTRTSGSQIHPIAAQLTDANGPLNIPPGTRVLFQARPLASTAPTISGIGSVVRPDAEPDDPNRGAVLYNLTASDAAQTAIFYCKWTLTPPSSSISQSFPEGAPMVLIMLANP